MSPEKLVNGVDVAELGKKAQVLKQEPDLAAFKFSVTNRWANCGENVTRIESFDGVGETHPHRDPFELTADEPPVLLGEDKGPNPVEYLLTALASCLTTSMVYHAAVRGIEVEEVSSTVEGDLDVRGFMDLAKDVPKGYSKIRVTFRVKSDAPAETLKECASFSPVYNTIGDGTEIDLVIEKA